MNTAHRAGLALLLAALADTAFAQAAADPIGNYLADLTPGSVTASDIIGAGSSAIQTIQTSQDFVAAIKSATSGDGKNGFGISITPARSDFKGLAMSHERYLGEERDPNYGNRALGSLTFSFATNIDSIQSASYRAYGVAVNTSLYWDKKNDPVYIALAAFATCKTNEDAALIDLVKARNAARLPTQPAGDTADQKALRQALDDRGKALTDLQQVEYAACAAQRIKTESRWNAARLSVSVGSGFLRAPDGAKTYDMGQSLSLNAQGELFDPDGAWNATYRHTEHTLDMTSVPAAPAYARTNLVALRATYGSQGGTSTQVLAEVSNATRSSSAAYTGAFLYALGLDKKLHEGVWVEFRFGRSRAVDSGTMQNTALLSLKLAPGASLFGSK